MLLGRETIFRDGQRSAGSPAAGSGYTVGKNIGYGYVRNPDGVDDALLTSGTYELEVATERVPCRLHLAPLYDPRGNELVEPRHFEAACRSCVGRLH